MSYTPKILAFAGSTRVESFNKKLLRIAVGGARAAGAEVTHLDLREIPMPLYDGDLETREGLPSNAKRFKQLMIDHEGLLIAAPEYNSSISAVLKNAIDWASRPEPNEPPLIAFTGKVAALMSASQGTLGGLRGLAALRLILGNINVLILPGQVAVPRAPAAFDDAGNLKDEKQRLSVEKLGRELTYALRKLKG
jgi:chromate reductase